MNSDADLPRGAIAVIFASRRTADTSGYDAMSARMETLAREQPGYLGMASVRDAHTGLGITVSYWADEDAAKAWKRVHEHQEAQRIGKARWYREYRVDVCEVIRSYSYCTGPKSPRANRQTVRLGSTGAPPRRRQKSMSPQ